MSSEHRTKNQHFGLFKGVRWVMQYTKKHKSLNDALGMVMPYQSYKTKSK